MYFTLFWQFDFQNRYFLVRYIFFKSINIAPLISHFFKITNHRSISLFDKYQFIDYRFEVWICPPLTIWIDRTLRTRIWPRTMQSINTSDNIEILSPISPLPSVTWTNNDPSCFPLPSSPWIACPRQSVNGEWYSYFCLGFNQCEVLLGKKLKQFPVFVPARLGPPITKNLRLVRQTGSQREAIDPTATLGKATAVSTPTYFGPVGSVSSTLMFLHICCVCCSVRSVYCKWKLLFIVPYTKGWSMVCFLIDFKLRNN